MGWVCVTVFTFKFRKRKMQLKLEYWCLLSQNGKPLRTGSPEEI
jgi:hypothetical protein